MAPNPLIPLNTPFRYNIGINYESWENGRTGYSITADLDQITKNFGASVDVLNIADEKDVYVTGALPRATYDNGRTIYFSLNAKY